MAEALATVAGGVRLARRAVVAVVETHAETWAAVSAAFERCISEVVVDIVDLTSDSIIVERDAGIEQERARGREPKFFGEKDGAALGDRAIVRECGEWTDVHHRNHTHNSDAVAVAE